ncbi:response regulator [Methanobacterium sp. SMA-27]|uniref:response regulator n=1 Tax=Methanobacterium sp. SMA-27 TaxID=1495336 RepID=UPI00064F5C24|nr:response regulator [Methanobacterium sp. SMA-27]
MLNIKILIVEDEIIMANDLKQQLEEIGYEVVGITGNGEDAIKKTGETKPDIILMDIVLKGEIDGIETTQQIRNLYNIPVIYLTSNYDDKILERAAKTYPAGYITKPYDHIGIHTAIQMAALQTPKSRKNKKINV